MSSENYETTGGEGLPEGVTVERDPRGANAQRHGILSEHVPPAERDAYAQHAALIREGTGASTYLEQRLADRASLALWRLDRVARYEAAQVSTAQRAARANIDAGQPFGLEGQAVTAWAALAALTGEGAAGHRADPQLSEEYAQDAEREAAHLERFAAGGSAEGLSKDDAAAVGWEVFNLLSDLSAPANFERKLAAAMLGRRPTRSEVDTLKESEWEFEPGELPGLLDYAREHWGKWYGSRLEALAYQRRAKAAQIREAQRAALAADGDALALAALPSPQALEKVTRYEAHLERVLYRSLHDLEAARREREGQATPPPLRGVLDELGE